jgi:hypothetical protein
MSPTDVSQDSLPPVDGIHTTPGDGVQMMGDERMLRVGLNGELQTHHASTAENVTCIRLDPERVPGSLRHLILLAERFGISDDLMRGDVIASTVRADLDVLQEAVADHVHLLDEWLAGPEAVGPYYSDEYVAFLAMRMAADGV